MRLKDGKQKCPKCQGNGCYWCRRQGWRAQCPVCMNSEPELITKDGNEFTCAACNGQFDSTGKPIIKPKPKPKVARLPFGRPPK